MSDSESDDDDDEIDELIDDDDSDDVPMNIDVGVDDDISRNSTTVSDIIPIPTTESPSASNKPKPKSTSKSQSHPARSVPAKLARDVLPNVKKIKADKATTSYTVSSSSSSPATAVAAAFNSANVLNYSEIIRTESKSRQSQSSSASTSTSTSATSSHSHAEASKSKLKSDTKTKTKTRVVDMIEKDDLPGKAKGMKPVASASAAQQASSSKIKLTDIVPVGKGATKGRAAVSASQNAKGKVMEKVDKEASTSKAKMTGPTEAEKASKPKLTKKKEKAVKPKSPKSRMVIESESESDSDSASASEGGPDESDLSDSEMDVDPDSDSETRRQSKSKQQRAEKSRRNTKTSIAGSSKDSSSKHYVSGGAKTSKSKSRALPTTSKTDRKPSRKKSRPVTSESSEESSSKPSTKAKASEKPAKSSKSKSSSSSSSKSPKKSLSIPLPPLSPRDAEITGLLIETMALSRASSHLPSALYKVISQGRPGALTDLSSTRASSDKDDDNGNDAEADKMSAKDWASELLRVLEIGCKRSGVFGKVESSFNDDVDNPLEAQWFYVPERDEDQERATLIKSLMPRPAKRNETKKFKQYYFKPLDKISRWDDEDAI